MMQVPRQEAPLPARYFWTETWDELRAKGLGVLEALPIWLGARAATHRIRPFIYEQNQRISAEQPGNVKWHVVVACRWSHYGVTHDDLTAAIEGCCRAVDRVLVETEVALLDDTGRGRTSDG